MKGLILKEGPANNILLGKKTVDIRGSRTTNRGRIGVVISGTKQVWGTVELYDCVPLTKDLFENEWRERHRSNSTYEELLKTYPKPYGWCLRDVKKFHKPVPYNHKQGCVIWVLLDDIVEELNGR